MDLDFLDNPKKKNNKDAFDNLLDFNQSSKKSLHQLSQTPPAPAPAANVDSNWSGLDMLSTMGSRTSNNTPQKSSSNDLLGDDSLIDDFGLLDVSNSAQASQKASTTNSDDGFDILGDLAKPVQQPQQSASPLAKSTPSPTPRSTSPPPHLVGQLVEMGFSPVDASQALKSANMDVSIAATMLISQSVNSNKPTTPQVSQPPQQQRPNQSRQSPAPQKQTDAADELIQQASAIGSDLFTKASSYWSVGKNMAQKAIEEQRQRVVKQQSDDDRLKKERERKEYEERKRRWEEGASSGFKDDDEPVQSNSFIPSEFKRPERPEPSRQSSNNSQEPSRPASQQSSGSLLDVFKPKSYVSPARHAVRSRTSTPPQAQTPVKPSTPKKQRVNPQISQQALAQSNELRMKGNEAFKLGSYGQAVDYYEKAATNIPPNHIQSAIIQTNLATTHIKNGDADSAIKAATAAIATINEDYEVSDGVNVLETASKSYRSRANAHEMNEKHADAQKDYEKLISISSKIPNIQSQAIEGLRRAKAAQEPKKNVSTNAKPANASIKAAGEKAAKAAVERSKAASLQEAAEDTQKHALKDGVDARLLTWKAGKENNIRALLSSVDTVLWPELGLKKFGMHELVTDVSVKKVYMRAVSKVHPDKINARTSTLEQRMIAQGVFATLNEAYNKQR
ncbi:hypothetical protein E3Q02_02380 [Wallemia mellicola]|uniref:UBA domain-containing protein n=1 Tax=Wallemia mellicola TaxID=1708541 RepID=A0AB38MTQ1_9BASI|nr:hypothetical protein E3Q12_02369 [Wallemia mellicola]TIC64960.1 hypothetical protein E3Q02_02380 [Wallemia mellicola]TIC66090.1 hypothetical protein E3Q03_02310 [Wallemia mellicola]